MIGCEKGEKALTILRRHAMPDIREIQKRVNLVEALVVEMAALVTELCVKANKDIK